MVALPVRPDALPRVDWRLVLHDGMPAAALAALLGLFILVITLVTRGEGQPGTPLPGVVASADDAAAAGALRLPGGQRSHGAQRLRLALPARASTDARWLVWIARDPVDAVWLETAGWRSDRLDFFAPRDREGLIPSAFLFPLDPQLGNTATIDLHAIGAMPVALRARLVHEDEAARWMQRSIALNFIVYTGTFVLALIAVALFWTMRDQFFLVLFAAAFLAGLLFAACNGHLYAVPGLRMLGGLREQGVWALAMLCAAAVVGLMQHLTDVRTWTRVVRFAHVVCGALVAASAVMLLGLELLAPFAQRIAYFGFVAAGTAGLLSVSGALRGKVAMVLPALLVLVLLLVACGLRWALAHGAVPEVAWTRYGYQIALLSLLVVSTLGLIQPIGAYRQQRDRERDARVDSERRMELEAARAGLARLLQARLRELSPADVEWTAFRLMLEHLLPHLNVDGAAVVARAYHGRDIVVTDPIEERRLTESMDSTRLAQLKRHAMSARPSQQAVTIGDTQRTEAVVPISIPLPGWGVLLLQREDQAVFDEDELTLAGEFVRLTVLHADEAVATHALRRTAELDALTGTFNRRSIDQWLARHFLNHKGKGMSLLFVDIDHFKRINDLYGHACGDHCLRQVALALRAGLRPDDVLGRYGGEEFIVLLPGCDGTNARLMAERLRSAVEECAIEWQGSEQRLTVSIGVATRTHGERTAAALTERADRALYEAKRGGRNRVSVAPATFLS